MSGCRNHLSQKEVISQTIETMDSLQSYSMILSVNITQNGVIQKFNVHLDYVTPDQMYMISIDETESFEVIRIGEIEYYRQTRNDEWQERVNTESSKPFIFNNPFSEFLKHLENVKQLENKIKDNKECFHYIGSIDMDEKVEYEKMQLDPSLSDYTKRLQAIEGYTQWEIMVELWIDQQDFTIKYMLVKQNKINTENTHQETAGEDFSFINALYRIVNINHLEKIESPLIFPHDYR